MLLAGALAIGASTRFGPTDVALHLVLKSVPAREVRALVLQVRDGDEVVRIMRLSFSPDQPMPEDLWHPARLPRGKLEVFVRLERVDSPAVEVQRSILVTGDGAAPRVEL